MKEGIKRKRVLLRIVRKLIPRFGLKSSDIILVTYPKSGTTWLRFIFCNIVSLLYLDGRVVDYHLLNGGLRCGFDSLEFPTLWPDQFSRVFVSHQPYDKRKFKGTKCIYLYRNPADVMVSFYEYKKSLRTESKFREDFKSFIRDDILGINAWCRHYSSWKDKAAVLLSYEEMKASPLENMQKVFNVLTLGCKVNNDVLTKAIERSSFESIRKLEKKSGLDKKASEKHEIGFRFARKGTVGQWVDYFDEADLFYLNSCLASYGLSKIIYIAEK